MTRCINLRDWESRRLLSLAAGEAAVLVRPVGLPPTPKRVSQLVPRQVMPWEPGVTEYAEGEFGLYIEGWPSLGRWGLHAILRCPFGRPGDTLIGRETWAAVWPGESEVPLRECRIEYRADLPPGCHDGPGEWPPECKSDPAAPKWMSPVTMPAWAARHRLTIVSVAVRHCVDVTEDEWRAAGHPVQGPLKGSVNGEPATIHVFDPVMSARAMWDEKRFPWATSHALVLTVRKELGDG